MATRRTAGARTGKATARITASRKSAPVKAATRKGAHAAAFPADCTIAQADDMKARLARLVSKPSSVTLDLSAVRRIDTAALQVLTAFVRERRAAGRAVECSVSEPFMLTAELLGLSALFASANADAMVGASEAKS